MPKIFTPPKDARGFIHHCDYCGNWCTGVKCSLCKTAAQRKEQLAQQIQIEKENSKKGHTIPTERFFVPV